VVPSRSSFDTKVVSWVGVRAARAVRVEAIGLCRGPKCL
jgi:hypothetical protein